jgi:hypothetical protein
VLDGVEVPAAGVAHPVIDGALLVLFFCSCFGSGFVVCKEVGAISKEPRQVETQLIEWRPEACLDES